LNEQKPGSRPDIAVFFNDTVIFFENKINSFEGDNQLKGYEEQLNKIGKMRRITCLFILQSTTTLKLKKNND
jgi:hypothetical protein